LVSEFEDIASDGPAKEYLKSWWCRPHEFANFVLRRNMTLNKKGSAPSEQNHSSIAAMIGSSNDDITRMVAALLSREAERTKAESTFLARQLLKSFQHAEGKGDGQLAELLKFVSRELSGWGAQLIQVSGKLLL
jgi:hypothetical protein